MFLVPESIRHLPYCRDPRVQAFLYGICYPMGEIYHRPMDAIPYHPHHLDYRFQPGGRYPEVTVLPLHASLIHSSARTAEQGYSKPHGEVLSDQHYRGIFMYGFPREEFRA